MAVFTISATVNEQDIALSLGDVKLVSGAKDLYQIQFTFSEEWNSYTKKVVFENPVPKRAVIEVLLSGTNIVTIPIRSLANPSFLRVGVYGVGTNNEVMPTVWSENLRIFEGTYQGYENPAAPDPDVYDEILAAMAGKQDLLTFDDVPTEDSDNPVKSGGVYSALETKADTNGIYPELVAGSAEQMLSGNYTVDKAPYLFRSVPYRSNRVRESIVGGSIGWNQLGEVNISTTTENGLTFTNNGDGSITVNGLATASSNRTVRSSNYKLLQNHVYYVHGYKRGTVYISGSLNLGGIAQDNGDGKIYKREGSDANAGFRIAYATGEKFENVKMYPMFHDLTLMFPSAIVDYIWSLEQATAGSGIAWLKSYGFFKDPYNAFDAGSIQSVSTDKKKVVGFNQFDKSQAVVGERFNTTGTGVVANTIARSAYIPCLPNTDYYISKVLPNQSSYSAVFWFDENKQYIRADGASGTAGQGLNMLKTSPANAMYVGLNFYVADLNGVCLNISDPARNGQYEPYQSTSYALDPSELRGVPKLDNGNLYYDGDVRKAIGQTERKYALLNLSNLSTWQLNDADNHIFRAQLQASVKYQTTVVPNALCPRYKTVRRYDFVNFSEDKTLCIYNPSSNNYLFIKDDSYSDVTTFKASLNGLYLVYELATPVTETSTPLPTIENIYANGTEEFTDYAVAQGTRDVAIPVGHESEYLEDSQAKLDGLPWNFASLIAPTEATYTATRNYSTGALLIVNNVLYKATANIANGGTITPNTNVTATTLAEVISAL